MSPKKNTDRFLKVSSLFLMFVLINSACEKDDLQIDENVSLIPKVDTLKDYSPEVSFEVTGRLFEGKSIDCIEPNYNGNTWIASGKELYHLKDGIQTSYTLEYQILDISIAGDESLWIGSLGGGLGCLSENGLTWYNKANSGLPRDSIWNVKVGLDGRIWFSSGAFDKGGLLVYDGKKFVLYTPENSILNQHVIGDIGIDHNGSIYVSTTGKVSRSNVYRITDDLWECLGSENGTFYWIMVYTVGPEGIIYLFVDYSLSSSFPIESNTIFEFSDNDWDKLDPDFMSSYTFIRTMKADRRNYCWACGLIGSKYELYVYDKDSWHKAPEGLFFGDNITTIQTDMNNSIWVGTSQNGVFILNQ